MRSCGERLRRRRPSVAVASVKLQKWFVSHSSVDGAAKIWGSVELTSARISTIPHRGREKCSTDYAKFLDNQLIDDRDIVPKRYP